MNTDNNYSRISINFTILVAALGYFVDVFDLIIFSIVRNESLHDLGIESSDSLVIGLKLLNFQLVGVVIGGFIWGIVGDKRGRLAVLFGSIILYSVANLANAFVHTEEAYIICRLLAGLGLAGELGAGVVLVTELLNKGGKRGYGTMLIAGIGLLGAVFAAWISTQMHWRNVFLVGGMMGLILLIMRLGVQQSKLYLDIRHAPIRKGDIIHLFSSWKRSGKYFKCIFVDTHMYFVVGILLTGSPEIAKALNVTPLPSAGLVIGIAYFAMSIGDFASGWLSQQIKSRKKALFIFHIMSLIAITIFLYVPSPTKDIFLAKASFLGFSIGSWAIINVNAAEQFGTNLRALAATTIPNLIRALLIPISYIFNILIPHYGIINSAAVIGICAVFISLFTLKFMEETFDKEMQDIEN